MAESAARSAWITWASMNESTTVAAQPNSAFEKHDVKHEERQPGRRTGRQFDEAQPRQQSGRFTGSGDRKPRRIHGRPQGIRDGGTTDEGIDDEKEDGVG